MAKHTTGSPLGKQDQLHEPELDDTAGLLVEEVGDEEDMYDADVEVVEPDEYEEIDSEDNLDNSSDSSESPIPEDDWQKAIVRGIRKLDCDSEGTSGSPQPGSSGKKRKRDDELTFFRNKNLRSRSPTPHVEIEEAPSDEPSQIVQRRMKVYGKRPRHIRVATARFADKSRLNKRYSSLPRSLPSSPLTASMNQEFNDSKEDMDMD